MIKGHCFNTKRASLYQPSPTLTASGGLIHWKEDRVNDNTRTQKEFNLYQMILF